MKKNLYINDVNVTDYGFYINSDTYLDAPLIDYNEYKIPARNGNVIQYNKRYENIIRKFECYIPDINDVQSVLDNLKNILYTSVGYVKILSDYEPEFYQYGYLAQEIKVKPFNTELSAKFELYFSCQPQKISITTRDDFYRKFEQGGYYILNANNSELVRSALDDLPYYAVKYNTYALCVLTQLGLASPVSIQSIYQYRIDIICELVDGEYKYVAFLGYRGGFAWNVDPVVPDEYNTSDYYLCSLVSTSAYPQCTATVKYGSTSMTKSFQFGLSLHSDIVSALGINGEIQLGFVQLYFTEQNIQDGKFVKDDGIMAFNDTYVKIDWYQMYEDGMLDIMRACTGNVASYLQVLFRVNMQTKKSYLYHTTSKTYTNIDKYVTIYGNFELKLPVRNNNYIAISRVSDFSVPDYQKPYYSMIVNVNGNWWKV